MVMKSFQSCAEWEQKHGFYENTTKDQHDTKQQAQAVCALLEKEGIGGEKIWFPIRTWIEERKEIPAPDGFALAWVPVS
jgi:hypothetical protein